MRQRPLLVCGCSGRDLSIMEALHDACGTNGAGALYWCGYGDGDIPDPVTRLLADARTHGKLAYYVPALGSNVIDHRSTDLEPPQYHFGWFNIKSRVRREHSFCASHLVPTNECHLRLRFPVAASWMSSTIAQRPGDLSRICPLNLILPLSCGLLRALSRKASPLCINSVCKADSAPSELFTQIFF